MAFFDHLHLSQLVLDPKLIRVVQVGTTILDYIFSFFRLGWYHQPGLKGFQGLVKTKTSYIESCVLVYRWGGKEVVCKARGLKFNSCAA